MTYPYLYPMPFNIKKQFELSGHSAGVYALAVREITL